MDNLKEKKNIVKKVMGKPSFGDVAKEIPGVIKSGIQKLGNTTLKDAGKGILKAGVAMSGLGLAKTGINSVKDIINRNKLSPKPTVIRDSMPRLVNPKPAMPSLIKNMPASPKKKLLTQPEQMKKNLEDNSKSGKYSNGIGVGN